MNIQILPASQKDQDVIQNLARFYAYDMSEYLGKFEPGWEFPENGLYEAHAFGQYWTEPDRHPFLIRINNELAGFVLIHKIGSSPDVDWNMGEFFIARRFTKQGVGRHVARWCFHNFPGVWEVMQMPGNEGAIQFWAKVINDYTQGNFEKALKDVEQPHHHSMVVLKFKTFDDGLQNLPPLKG